jgi:hypothetical protein
MTRCGLCLHPIRRRWWHWLIRPLPVHMGAEAAGCRVWLDEHGDRVLIP